MRAEARRRPGSAGRSTLTFLVLAAAGLTAAGCEDNETAIARGDRLWADSSFDAATAEYRLAVAQRGDEEALSRLAHAYVRTGRLREARDVYDRLLAISPGYADQAAYDFLQLIDRALRRNDPLDVASGLEAALSLRPELQLPDAVRPVARLHRERGDLPAAAAFYRRALMSMPPDSAPAVLYELGLLNEELGECATAIDYYSAFREQAERVGARRWRTLLTEARWHTGGCAFQLAREARAANRPTDALAHLDHMLALGEPENLLDQAWFDRGEVLFGIGRYDEALESYRTVVRRNPSRTGQLVERAQRRIDDIRFGDFSVDTTRAPLGQPQD